MDFIIWMSLVIVVALPIAAAIDLFLRGRDPWD